MRAELTLCALANSTSAVLAAASAAESSAAVWTEIIGNSRRNAVAKNSRSAGCSRSSTRSRVVMRSDLDDLLWRAVQGLARTLRTDQVVVTDDRKHLRRHDAGVHHDAHSGGDRHGFIVPYQRPLDHVVAPTMGVEPLLLGEPVCTHVLVEGCKHVRTACAGLEQAQEEPLRELHALEALAQERGGPAEDEDAADFSVVAAGTTHFDQQAEMLA